MSIAWPPIDLAYSKLIAGREKDFEFVAGLLHYKIVRQRELQADRRDRRDKGNNGRPAKNRVNEACTKARSRSSTKPQRRPRNERVRF